MNSLELLIIYTLIDFIAVFAAYRIFGKTGLYIFIIISVIAANIQVNKSVEYYILGHHFIATLGNVMFGGIFMANDLLNEKYGRHEARKAVGISLFFGLTFMFLMFFSTLYISTNDPNSINTNNALQLLFSINGGALKAILIGNVVYLVSQMLDVLIYSKFKNYNSEMKWLWARNTGSTLLSQIVDTTLITIGFAYAGIIPKNAIIEIIIATLIIKYIIAFINAPLFYLLAFIKPSKKFSN